MSAPGPPPVGDLLQAAIDTIESPDDRSSEVVRTFRQYVEHEGGRLPLPGSGRTWARFEGLKTCAAADLSVGRLVEGHVDALAILAEAGVTGRHPGAAYGVWAAFSGSGDLEAEAVPGGWRLQGSKAFCSGSSSVQRALVTARTSDGPRLFDIDVAEHVVSVDADSWPAVGMADSDSQTLTFDGPVVAATDAIGGPGFYSARPGFWFGAVGVAACWYGGAVGLVDHLLTTLRPEPGEHVLADLGRAVTRISAMGDVLLDAARCIDADPHDADGSARLRAFKVRQTVHDSSLEVLSATAAAGGARPLCHHRSQARRAADLYVYLAQHHGGADAAEIGRMALQGQPWS
jgi:alkylation response protein AidB-like acyl-CoA dehydrogenase